MASQSTISARPSGWLAGWHPAGRTGAAAGIRVQRDSSRLHQQNNNKRDHNQANDLSARTWMSVCTSSAVQLGCSRRRTVDSCHRRPSVAQFAQFRSLSLCRLQSTSLFFFPEPDAAALSQCTRPLDECTVSSQTHTRTHVSSGAKLARPCNCETNFMRVRRKRKCNCNCYCGQSWSALVSSPLA